MTPVMIIYFFNKRLPSSVFPASQEFPAAMSKSDLPPSYDDWPGPPAGSYPQPPAYPPPAYEDPALPAPYPPFPPYPGTYAPGPQPPHPTPYPGQPGVYPQPRQGGDLGYPTPGVPHIMPPVFPTGTPITHPNSGHTEGFASAGGWSSMAVRHAFIQKVYLILAAQLLVTVSIVAVFIFVEPVRLFVIRNPGVYWASYVVYLVCYIVLSCCEGPRRRYPWNLIFLAILTLAMSYMTGALSSYYDTKAVFLALGITVIVCVSVTVFCFQTKVDFTACRGIFCVLGMVFMVTGIITIVVLSFHYVPWLDMLFAAIGTIVFTLFLALHTQLVIGNRKHSISPEEYVFAALSIYLDVIQIFTFLIQLTSGSSRND
ncbi:protein lifeguard 3-like isoform X2 [Conger conger]|uniref:protein lifeguard 3-like isoform X2 n=1 Tax=Conger conger TaxID=82655 RepID=UPI002A59E1F0|nr:protein lifeguard 3-like isoform X2 [Conger conger]